MHFQPCFWPKCQLLKRKISEFSLPRPLIFQETLSLDPTFGNPRDTYHQKKKKKKKKVVCRGGRHIYLVVSNNYLSILFLGFFRHKYFSFFSQNVVFFPHHTPFPQFCDRNFAMRKFSCYSQLSLRKDGLHKGGHYIGK